MPDNQHVCGDNFSVTMYLLLVCKIDNNAALQWFWATWEAAQFCVLAKLRTPLGKPQDTFTMIEAVLKKYSTEGARRDADDAKTKSGGGGDNQDEKSNVLL